MAAPFKINVAGRKDALKLLICDINQSTLKSLKKLDICGIICSYNEYPPRVVLEVDDGTGSITCFVNYEKLQILRDEQIITTYEKEVSAQGLHQEVTKASLHLLANVRKTCDSIRPTSFTVGTCVQVKGFVFEANGDIKINAFEVYALTPTMEINRMAEMAAWYDRIRHSANQP